MREPDALHALLFLVVAMTGFHPTREVHLIGRVHDVPPIFQFLKILLIHKVLRT
jgi:hypothetical protein